MLVLVGIAGTLMLRSLAIDQALDQAREFTLVSSHVVERRVDDGLLTGDARASAAVASAVFDFVILLRPVGRHGQRREPHGVRRIPGSIQVS